MCFVSALNTALRIGPSDEESSEARGYFLSRFRHHCCNLATAANSDSSFHTRPFLHTQFVFAVVVSSTTIQRDAPMMPSLRTNSDPFRRNTYNRINLIYEENVQRLQSVSADFLRWYRELSPRMKIVYTALGILGFVAVIFILIFHQYIIGFLIFLSDVLVSLKYGKLLLFTLVFVVGFPPLLGFSPLSMLCGMAYGFPYGWPLLATASITGLFCSFLVFRYVLHNQAVHLINSNEKVRAFSDILKEESSLLILILLRLCPLPYSLSNGALAAIPELPAWKYALASIITSPKLFIHVFVGLKFKHFGSEKTTSSKLVDLVSIIITGLASALTTYLVYNKMQAKLDAYHQQNNFLVSDAILFGNFDDESINSSAANVELDSANFDIDNFMIGDDDDDEPSKPLVVERPLY